MGKEGVGEVQEIWALVQLTKFLTKASLGYMETLFQQYIKRKRRKKEARLDLVLPVTHRKLLVCYHFTDK